MSLYHSISTYFQQIGMADSTNTSHTIYVATFVNTNCRRKTRGATMYTKVKKIQEVGVHYPVTVDVAIDRAYGEHTDDFIYYIVLQGRSKVNILIDSWHNVE